MDYLPKIIALAQIRPEVRVECRRPSRMAKELRKHLPFHEILVNEVSGHVLLRARITSKKCSDGPVCTPGHVWHRTSGGIRP